MLHLSWDLASCGWHLWIPGLHPSELRGLVAERQHALCRANIVLWSSVTSLPSSSSLGFSCWSCYFRNHSLLHLASGSWQSLHEWMGLSMLCFVQNSVRGRSSSSDHTRRQDGFHQLWRAMVCGWACAVWNVSAEQGHLKAVTSISSCEWWKWNIFPE